MILINSSMMKQSLKENKVPLIQNCNLTLKTHKNRNQNSQPQLNIIFQLTTCHQFTEQAPQYHPANDQQGCGSSQRRATSQLMPQDCSVSHSKRPQRVNGAREQKSKRNKQNSSIGTVAEKFSVTLPCGFKEREQHREQRNHFQKMSLVIDRKDKKCSIKQNLQNLIILASSITKVKTLIYKHYKTIILRKQPHQINSIRYYCATLFLHFKELIKLIQNNVDKNQNYKKYQRTLKKYEPSINQQSSSLEQHLQCLLFYFSSLIELKRFYDVSSQTIEFSNGIPLQVIYSITNQAIRIRHYLGFLAKFIADPLMQENNSKITKIDSKQLWKQIYQKKYISKTIKSTCK